jgi:LmbE family N-acetylglucosaminyl deacetylase
MPENKRLLVIAAHPDDEVLGCAATVHKLVADGWQASLAVMSAGVGGRYDTEGALSPTVKAGQAALQDQMRQAANIIGYVGVDAFNFPDNRMDSVSRTELSRAIRPVIDRVRPSLVLTHHPGDYNWDHTRTYDAVMMAARRNPPDFSPDEIWLFEVLSSTERAWQARQPFLPSIYVDVAGHMAVKEQALESYVSELREPPHPRSIAGIRALAAMRGHQVGLAAAEAFELVRRVIS